LIFSAAFLKRRRWQLRQAATAIIKKANYHVDQGVAFGRFMVLSTAVSAHVEESRCHVKV
jgi:hypothetical protein